MKVTNKKKSKHRGYHGYEPGPYDTPDKLREKGSKPYENPVGKKVNTRVDVPGMIYDKSSGFNILGFHKNGTKYDNKGYDFNGFNAEGYNKKGFDKKGKQKN